MIQLPFDWCACERGNTLLSTGEGNIVAWLDLPGGEGRQVHVHKYRLEVTYTPDNYPSLNVQIVRSSDEELAAHINSQLGGWLVHKCNVDGVVVELNRVRVVE
jgi:hypothetical protein